MSPSARPVAKRTGNEGRQVQPRVLTRFAPSSVNSEAQVLQFREARKLREKARLEKLRDRRLKGSAASSSFNASTSSSISTRAIPLRNVLTQLSTTAEASGPKASSVIARGKLVIPTGSQRNQQPQSKTGQFLANTNCLPTRVKLLPSKLRKSQDGRKSILKTRVRKIPKAEVKLTKTTQLRMLKNDPFLELSSFLASSSRKMVLPLPVPLAPSSLKQCSSMGTKNIAVAGSKIKPPALDEVEPQSASGVKPKSTLKIVPVERLNKLQSPSHIPVRKTSFVSPLKRTPVTPKPSPLRERLAEWLEKRDHSLDNFKHLKCFGVLGPVVKRPQTPFRKTILSTSTLKAIPENAEATSINELLQYSSDEDVGELNTTFTLEEEDKENIGYVRQQEPRAVSENVSETQDIKELDQAHGVLSELHNLIKMGYPIEQCGLWLRAVRRRFPQCGDEAIYWECLASIEEARGDLQTAVSCYERALLQGAESSVQNSLDELLKKMLALRIEPVPDVSRTNASKLLENQLLNSSNIINSSSIQFAVQEKCGSSKKSETLNENVNSVLTATPVRRSMRFAGTPKKGTPGVTCVRSLEFLEPDVRSSIVFHSNSALDLD